MEKGLIISAIGMGLVFVLIILLWFIMAFLVKVTENFKGTKEEETPVEEAEIIQLPVDTTVNKAQLAAALAAATVVAMTLKAKKPLTGMIQTSSSQLGSSSSSWLNAGRVRQILARKGR
jgi:Na+-transporting methylmalonyl-CoA/oxaloacetate decarboxylase gamma subunit